MSIAARTTRANTTPAAAPARAQDASESEELARVVVARESHDNPAVPWYVRLRAWLFCLLFLLIAEAGARLEFDTGLSLQHERFDNFPNAAAEDAFVSQIQRDRAFRVVVIGDSVVVGASLLNKDQTIPRCLEAALSRRLPGRSIHIWNMAVAGSRSADELCILEKVLDAKPDLVVIEGNYMMFASRTELMPIANPWLAYNLHTIPGAVKGVMPSREYKQVLEDAVTDFAEKHWRFYGMRQAICGLAIGVQPRSPYNSPNPAVMITTRVGKALGKLPMESWDRRGMTPTSMRFMYTEDVRPDNLNGSFYPIMLAELRRSHVLAFDYLTPQNPAMMDAIMGRSEYDRRRGVAASFFADPNVPFRDYDSSVPSDEFYDNDHMLPGGNRRLAERLAGDIAPIIEKSIASRGRGAGASDSRVTLR